MIQSAMRESGVDASGTIMIGDTSFDMLMARSANVGALGVSWGYHDVGRLAAAGAHDICHSSDDLWSAIERRLQRAGVVP